MKSRATEDFWKLFHPLSRDVKRQAYKAYRQWKANPHTGSLRFKRVSASESIYSVRIGRNYRALGYWDGETIYWYWIGNHDEYDRLLKAG